MHTFTVTEQGANVPLINHTRSVAPLLLTLQPPPLMVAARNARGRGISTKTAPITFVRGATAGAWGTLSPIALR